MAYKKDEKQIVCFKKFFSYLQLLLRGKILYLRTFLEI